jgi:glycosyltransferase involved in cell wall biosynthesis
MKILHIASYKTGGAGIASLRIHKKLIEEGFSSRIIFLDDLSKNFFKLFLNKLFNFFNKYLFQNRNFPKKEYLFLNNREHFENGLNYNFVRKINNVDVIFIHWISNHLNTFDIYNLYYKTNARIIFIMMDLAHITGGCHYPLNCTNYTIGCLDCPALNYKKKELAFKQHLSKSINITKFKGEIIAFSDKDLKMAIKSSIPFYKYWRLDIPFEKPNLSNNHPKYFTILPSAYSFLNIRKGINYFKQILYILEDLLNNDETIYIYNIDYPDYFKKYFKKIKFKDFNFYNNSTSLQELYDSSSVLLFTSIADSAPQMIVEALMSNTKVYSFNVGYVSELINQENGKIIENNNVLEMANSIYAYYRKLNNENKFKENFSITDNVSKYYEGLHFRSQINKILDDC